MEATDLTWRKARASGNGGNCVEVAASADGQHVCTRDSNRREAGHLTVTAGAWQRFLATAKDGAGPAIRRGALEP